MEHKNKKEDKYQDYARMKLIANSNVLQVEQSGLDTDLQRGQDSPAIAPVGTFYHQLLGTIGSTGPETTTAPVADIAGQKTKHRGFIIKSSFWTRRIRKYQQLEEA
jgi:hypothetical protein